jgi:CheY-like chemotaxis protein
MLLELGGHEVWTAHSGPEALERAAAVVPEFVLLDLGMPGMDGYEAGRLLRCRSQPLAGWENSGFRRM